MPRGQIYEWTSRTHTSFMYMNCAHSELPGWSLRTTFINVVVHLLRLRDSFVLFTATTTSLRRS
jgi:hypothetical protein